MESHTFCCPQCGEIKEPEWVIGTRSYSARRLDVPYFMCGKCRLIDVDKNTVRRALSEWRNSVSLSKNTPPYQEIYKEILEVVNRVVEYYCQTAGYKRRRFRKVTS
jgi:predicted RNA-binding Zn-ribbon protein involved in translation (DUF1610 family)